MELVSREITQQLLMFDVEVENETRMGKLDEKMLEEKKVLRIN